MTSHTIARQIENVEAAKKASDAEKRGGKEKGLEEALWTCRSGGQPRPTPGAPAHLRLDGRLRRRPHAHRAGDYSRVAKWTGNNGEALAQERKFRVDS